jgi:hypothetical protein
MGWALLVVKSVALVFCFFLLFGSFIKIQLNLDIVSHTPALLLLLKFLNSFSPMVNKLWVSKLKKANVPCWICNDYRSSGCK